MIEPTNMTEALRLAEIFSSGQYNNGTAIKAAAELRRQHAEWVSMRAERRHTERELTAARAEVEGLREMAGKALEYMESVDKMDMYPYEYAIVESLRAALKEPK